jgi:hypothetical protein
MRLYQFIGVVDLLVLILTVLTAVVIGIIKTIMYFAGKEVRTPRGNARRVLKYEGLTLVGLFVLYLATRYL